MQMFNIEELEKFYTENNFKRIKIRTGIQSLDDMLEGGISRGVTVLGGMPGYGKTTLAFQIAYQMKNDGKKVVFYSYEMPAIDFAEKSIKLKMLQGAEACEEHGELFIVDAEDIYLEDLEKHIKQQKENNSDLVIIIDYLQIIPVKQSNDVRAKVEKCIESLSKLAKKLQIPIILISSLSREAYKNKKGTIEMSSFKESGVIEYSATTILGIEATEQEDATYINCNIRVLKNRYGGGKGRTVPTRFYGKEGFFKEVRMSYTEH